MEYTQQVGPAAEVGARDAVGVVWRRKWIILLIMAVFVGGSYLLTRKMPRLYKATSNLMLMGPMPTAGPTPDAPLASPLIETPQTQINMLRADKMSWQVKRWLKIRMDSLETEKSAAILGHHPYGDIEAELKELEAVDQDRTIWKHYADHVSVSNPEGTNLINVSVVLPSPEKTATLANAIGHAFEDWKTEIAQGRVDQVTRSLEDRARRAEKSMKLAEEKETDFKLQHNMADVPVQQRNVLDQYLAHEAEISPLQTEVAAGETIVRDLRQRLAETNHKLQRGPARDDSEVVRLQQALQERQQKLDAALREYTPEHPIIPPLKAEVRDIQDQLQQARRRVLSNAGASTTNQTALFNDLSDAEGKLKASREKLRHAMAARNALGAQTHSIPAMTMAYARLSRDADLARALNAQLQTALSSANLNKDTSVGNVKLVSDAVTPDSPFQPDPVKNLLLGALIGLAVSIGCALMLEQSDRRVRAVKDVRRLVRGPIVGALPSLSRNQLNHMVRGELPPVAMETYGMVRANLAMALRKNGQADPWHRQIILVTSAIPGEGKSLTAAQMARSLARSGKTVILVDADMRRPSQNRLFNTAEPVGLADVLTNGLPLTEALVTSDTENLSILHSGMPVRNPTELVSLPQMVETLEALRSEADVVIVDAPACAAMADALLIAPHVDCIFYVIGVGMVDEQTMAHTMSALNAASPTTMVYFVNRTPKQGNKAAYRSYYSYQYSYADAGGTNGNGQPPLPLPAADDGAGAKGGSAGPRESAK